MFLGKMPGKMPGRGRREMCSKESCVECGLEFDVESIIRAEKYTYCAGCFYKLEDFLASFDRLSELDNGELLLAVRRTIKKRMKEFWV